MQWAPICNLGADVQVGVGDLAIRGQIWRPGLAERSKDIIEDPTPKESRVEKRRGNANGVVELAVLYLERPCVNEA